MPEKTVIHFNSTGMDPQALAEKVTELIENGYYFLFDHRGWKYFAIYTNNKPAEEKK